MTLGEKIWRLRESQHMSQEELAEKLQVSRQTVSNWENNKVVLDVEKLAKMCRFFGVSADDMINEEGIPLPATQNQEILTTNQRKDKNLIAMIPFAILPLLLIIIAAIGLIVSDDKVSVSSLITFHSNYIWVALLVLGIAALIDMIVAYLRRKF